MFWLIRFIQNGSEEENFCVLKQHDESVSVCPSFHLVKSPLQKYVRVCPLFQPVSYLNWDQIK
jgi:hypothetical protein